jgi:hypothetical protein
MRSREIKIVLGFLGLAIFQVAWHWSISAQGALPGNLLRIYLHHNPHSHKGVSGYLDFALPAIILGLLIGRVGWDWPIRKLSCFVAFGGIALVALLPAYILFLDKKQVWWWPKTSADFGAWLIGNMIMTIFLIGVCTYGGRLWGIDSHDKGKDNASSSGPAPLDKR